VSGLFLTELRRKALHAAGSLIAIAYYFTDKRTLLIGLAIVNAVLLIVEWQRLKGKIRLPEILLRPHEKEQVGAYIYFQIAALISVVFFEKTIAIAAILMLSLGDTASGLSGALLNEGNVRYSRKKFTIKPLAIVSVMFAVCVLIGFIMVSLPLAKDMEYISLLSYVAGALGATLGDAVPFRVQGKPIDDNLLIPLLSGIFMTIANVLL
jgi:dolichol kinase